MVLFETASIRKVFLRILLFGFLPVTTLVLADNKLDPIKDLQRTPVSRFEWGLERYRNALVEHFRIDPISLQPSVPPFFINVIYSEQKSEILVEIGRTFGSTEESRAKEFCEEYIVRARSMLAVDKLGRPVSNGVSTLAADYFFSALTDEEVDRKAASALDEIVVLRGLVVAPASGIYAVCDASLTNMAIRHLQ